MSSTTNMDTDNNFEVEEKPVVILKTHRNSLYLFLFEHDETRLASKVSLSIKEDGNVVLHQTLQKVKTSKLKFK